MLASITPLGERGRHSHWALTIAAFAIGALAAAVAAGALLGLAGSLVLSGAVSSRGRLALLVAAALVALALDARPRAVPGPRRQVNERWLDEYRGWVYGLGFGAQLGVGVSTIVTSAATYVGLLAAFLAGDPLRGALIMACYGAVRGLTPLASARVRTPDGLVLLLGRLDRGRGAAARVTTGSLAVVAALALAGALG